MSRSILGLLIAVFLVLGSYTLYRYAKQNFFEDPNTLYQKDDYHIVFLDNNLFYFCRFGDYNLEYIECKDPYYLVRKKVEEEDGTKEDKVYIRRPEEEEIYKPEGSIFIKKDTIVYIAKLAEDSPVLEYIDQTK